MVREMMRRQMNSDVVVFGNVSQPGTGKVMYQMEVTCGSAVSDSAASIDSNNALKMPQSKIFP